MERGAVEFLRNTSLVGLLNLLTFAVFVLIGLATIIVGRRPGPVYRRIRWGLVPLLVGLATMCLGYYFSDIGMMSRPTPEVIALNIRDALIHGVIGVCGAAIFVGVNLIARQRKT